MGYGRWRYGIHSLSMVPLDRLLRIHGSMSRALDGRLVRIRGRGGGTVDHGSVKISKTNLSRDRERERSNCSRRRAVDGMRRGRGE